ncbi:hypothetical protein DM02DRAFT_634945 [Periconia macrospinosa]|uniref:Uncharacterized protein n=1 Tax=Periconia macrospinosa TaxID=97972 RepID=A0A2V1D6U9_9PLEO|nr:hypothetical protein DM02DRAFT_634945 [Periconia macrospinosa]
MANRRHHKTPQNPPEESSSLSPTLSSSEIGSTPSALRNHSTTTTASKKSKKSKPAANRKIGVLKLRKASVAPLDRHGSVSPLAPKSTGVKKGSPDHAGRKNRNTATGRNGIVYNASSDRLRSLRSARNVNYNVDDALRRQMHGGARAGVTRTPTQAKKKVPAKDARPKPKPKETSNKVTKSKKPVATKTGTKSKNKSKSKTDKKKGKGRKK